MATTFTGCASDTAYVVGTTVDLKKGKFKMVNKIRRLKITVRTKEMVILEHGTDHKTQVADDTDFATCPVCHAPMKTLPRADPELDSTKTALEKKSTK